MKNIDKIYQNTPIASITYLTKNDNKRIEKYEDIHKEEFISVFNQYNKVKFRSAVSWNEASLSRRLIGSPEVIDSSTDLGFFQSAEIEIDITKALNIAFKTLKEDNLGEAFVGSITLSWELYYGVNEPVYLFTSDTNETIQIGAYSGRVNDLNILKVA